MLNRVVYGSAYLYDIQYNAAGKIFIVQIIRVIKTSSLTTVVIKITINLVFQAQYKRISKRRLMFRAALELLFSLIYFLVLLPFLLKSKCCCRDIPLNL